MKVLLVEDNEELNKTIKKFLELKNYQVDSTFDGDSAINMINNNYYDLYIMDINLPNKTGLEVLKYIRDNNLVERVRNLEPYFFKKLNELKNIDYVGDVRGKGLFAGIEFVKNKKTKETFNPLIKFSRKVAEEAFRNGLITYPGSGGVDGVRGDHILLCPPYIIKEEEIDEMVDILKKAIKKVSKIV